jgi:luciferase family oxidoreductase group 1
VKLSIIDQCPVPAGFTTADAFHNTIELAQLADRLGFERYWIAEHHATGAFASPAPEIMIARVAAETSHIRVGSGGVMLPHYSSMKVAESFRVLHALYPGRIDLGIGRAPGGSPLDSFALRRDRSAQPPEDDFPKQLLELIAFLHHSFRPDHAFSRIELSPAMPGAPEVWLLGSSMWSAAAAAQLGLPYAFAHFIDPSHTRAAIEYYRAPFKPTKELAAPLAILGIGAICAPTDAEADRMASSVRLFVRRMREGARGPIPTPEDALAQLGPGPLPDDVMARETGEWPRAIVGTPGHVRDTLVDIASLLHLDEVMLVTVVHNHQARLRSHELLADAFGLRPRSDQQ